MQITEVKVFPVSEEKLKAFVSVVFDGCFMVNDIKIINGRDGLFISMPSRKKKSGEFKDVAHPLNNETRRMIEGLVLDEYERILAERSGRGEHSPGQPRSSARNAVPNAAPNETAGDAASGESAADRPATAAAQQAPSAPRKPESGKPSPAAKEELEAPMDADEEERRRSLKEIEEIHLSDSFWSMS